MSEAVGMPCRDQVHDTLPYVGKDPCLIKQKGFVEHMVVGKLFLFLGLSFPVCKNKEMPPSLAAHRESKCKTSECQL